MRGPQDKGKKRGILGIKKYLSTGEISPKTKRFKVSSTFRDVRAGNFLLRFQLKIDTLLLL